MQSHFGTHQEALPPISIHPLTLKNNIRCDQLSFSYYNDNRIYSLQNINLVIPSKSMVAITGPSGSGKTTLADLLMGLLTPVEGTIFIDEKSLKGDLLHQWRNSVGYVPQETFLFNDSIRANLLWAKPDASEAEIWEALQLAAARSFVSNLPKGLNTILGDRGILLSGGERQRIALARALLRKPTLLLLDEATSSLDMENESHIQDAIEGLHGELTMVIIAHRLSTIERADKIVVLESGRIKEVKLHEQFSIKTLT